MMEGPSRAGQKRKSRDSPDASTAAAAESEAPAAQTQQRPPQPHPHLERQAPFAWAASALRSWQLGSALRNVYYAGTHMPVDGWFQPCRFLLLGAREMRVVNRTHPPFALEPQHPFKKKPTPQLVPIVDDL